MTKLFPANELLGAAASASDLQSLKSDPRGFLAARNLEVSDDVTVDLAENSASEVHLALPYYSVVTREGATALDTEKLSEVSGGIGYASYSDEWFKAAYPDFDAQSSAQTAGTKLLTGVATAGALINVADNATDKAGK